MLNYIIKKHNTDNDKTIGLEHTTDGVLLRSGDYGILILKHNGTIELIKNTGLVKDGYRVDKDNCIIISGKS